MVKRFSKIVIANRGEIAVSIINTARTLGVETVAIYADGEEFALHVQQANEAVSLGSGSLQDTYLNIDKIVNIALETGAEAIHPGYGFLSENADFAKACKENGLVFIGPSEEVLRKMGNKVVAKSIAQKAGVRILSGNAIHLEDIERHAASLVYPVLIKAAFGGGGKGMQVVHNANELVEKATSAARSALNYFGNGEIFVEEFVQNARHIEVQVLGDSFGNLVHLFERDCTVQRNHQKIIEEAPAFSISNELREKIHEAALAICREIGYENAGTVEFLVDREENFYFLEMNPRIQVEHPVTEQITGIDIVNEQLSIAAGNALSFNQNDIVVKGHAIEVRLYAEDLLNNFAPSAKAIEHFRFPSFSGIRVETDLSNKSVSALQFDPLLCKLISTAKTRELAIKQLVKALKGTAIIGPETNQEYLLTLLQTTDFQTNKLATNYCEVHHEELIEAVRHLKQKMDKRFIVAAALTVLYPQNREVVGNVWNKIGFWRMMPEVNLNIDGESTTVGFHRNRNSCNIIMGQETFDVHVTAEPEDRMELCIGQEKQSFTYTKLADNHLSISLMGHVFLVYSGDLLDHYPQHHQNNEIVNAAPSDTIFSHLHGKIVHINIEKGQTIGKGDLLMVIESMKSENKVLSPGVGKVKKITVSVGDQVADQMPLVYLEDI
jgi:acetyl/propionyl-CoA carboxylase alpha subunit